MEKLSNQLNIVESNEDDLFINRVKELSNLDLQAINFQAKMVTMLMGPTGSGKSTILNMLAGNKFICELNEEDEWEISADPSVATIGHKNSETLVPNYWIDSQGNIYFDCAGFGDTRGVDYEIAKSFFLKAIGDYAKSFKIILVVEFACLKAERLGVFAKRIEEIKSFLPSFDFAKDTELIVTKCSRKKSPFNVVKMLKNKMDLIYSESKVTMLAKPDRKTKTLELIDCKTIFERAPSLNKKCYVPLSEQSQLKIKSLISEFNRKIREIVRVFARRIDFYYLNLLQNNLEVDDITLSIWFSAFSETKHAFKNVTTADQFVLKFQEVSHNLASIARNTEPLISGDILLYLKKEIDNLSFLEKISSELQHYMISWWCSDFDFCSSQFTKNNNLAQFKNRNLLVVYLQEKNIDINQSIKSQIHQILEKPSEFSADYSGMVTHSGKQAYSGYALYSGYKYYSGHVDYSDNVDYTIDIPYSGSKSYSGTVYTPSCSHNRGFFNVPCVFCYHGNREVSYNGDVSYSGSVSHSSSVRNEGRAPYSGEVYYSGNVPYSGCINYDVNVPYSASHNVTCEYHHVCSCEELASLVFSLNEICKDIRHYQSIIRIQKQWLKDTESCDKNQEFDVSDFLSNLTFKGQTFSDLEIDKNDLANKIHEILSQSYSFSATYQGKTPYSINKSYSGSVYFSGNQYYSGTLHYKDCVNYSGKIPYSGSKNYFGKVGVKSCYNNCTLCNAGGVEYFDKSFSGSVNYSGEQYFSGSKSYSNSKSYSGYVNYSGNQPYSGEVNCQGEIPYENTHCVTCQKESEIGQGHHDCESCNAWEIFVSKLLKMLEEKEKCINIIQEQKKKLLYKD